MTLSYDELRALDARHVWHPFTQAGTAKPSILALGAKGATIYAADGREYLDMVSSWWVNLHGHANPAIAQAVADQAGRLEQVIFADFTHEPAARLAHRVCKRLPEDLNRVFYSDDGSTAVEVALKLAHQYWRNRGQHRSTYIAFEGGYHGDTAGAMSAGHSSGYFEAWKEMLFPVETVPFPATWDGDQDVEAKELAALDALDMLFSTNPDHVAAVIIEPLIQGASGMRMCRPNFLRKLEAKVREHGSLLILDEVMTGFGRTGEIFACVKSGITPDLICLSKGLTGGFLPLSMTVARDGIFEAFLGQDLSKAFLHGHSYTANPIGCAAGLASIDLLEAPSCLERIKAIEAIHRRRLDGLKGLSNVAHTRLTGTVAALDVIGGGKGYEAVVGPKMKAAFLERGLLLRPLGNVLYLLPPYCIGDGELERAWDGVEEVLRHLAK
ncbi:Adenosylmethionine-8-amino-7-oxononanoate aminotransferase [Paramagnetospirillum magnetotacticum MS-1]|uniref:Adenosylmethionine-8-amino-7-oxononanoate aminotransferase n=1 Tax=Paramagnetospirillum magnetotacticum MS-1 TaxID=272627 RepID=A0A0C2UZU8_PARME|nr:adenosylmethionine--8-amino-7-oxononanoate transaminase [Paramagnetospirillum magnetotacticum]KIL98356.1 Adenosylmethionine-8-amino-7-oxononanoate aminotransferase [Paramagnetospirillum magnetotacticum MS-1]